MSMGHDKKYIIDRSKLRRERIKARKINANIHTINLIKGLYFDGRIDITRLRNGTIKKEEHITLLSEPGNEYIGHISPNKSTSIEIYSSIIKKLDGKLKELLIVGTDGACVNTGKHNGVIRKLEEHVTHKVHWAVSKR